VVAFSTVNPRHCLIPALVAAGDLDAEHRTVSSEFRLASHTAEHTQLPTSGNAIRDQKSIGLG
jgi:hypothetical protein